MSYWEDATLYQRLQETGNAEKPIAFVGYVGNHPTVGLHPGNFHNVSRVLKAADVKGNLLIIWEDNSYVYWNASWRGFMKGLNEEGWNLPIPLVARRVVSTVGIRDTLQKGIV